MAINKSFKNKTFYCQKSLSCFTAKQMKNKELGATFKPQRQTLQFARKRSQPQKDFAPNLKKKKKYFSY